MTGAGNEKKQAVPLNDAQRIRLIEENVRDYAILTLDVDDRIISWNAGAQRITGYSEKEALGSSGSMLFTPEDCERGEDRKEIEKARLSGRAEDERWHLRKDGSRFWASGALTALRDESGDIHGFVKIFRDLTEQRERERSLRQKANLLDLAHDAIFVHNMENRITYWNHGSEQLYGWSREEAAGCRASELLKTEFPGSLDDVKRSLEEVGSWEGEIVHTCRNGNQIVVASRWVLHQDDEGGEPSILEINRDITFRKRYEQQIENLNRRLHRAMAEAHHRIKNNLQVASALVEMQTNTDEPVLPVSELKRVGQHLRSMAAIHDLLTQEVKEKAEASSVSMLSLLHKLLPLLQRTVDSRPLRVDIQDVELPARHGASFAILTNELVSNAVKHGAGEIDLELHCDGTRVRLQVCDQGPGFPPGFSPRQEANTGLELIQNISEWDLAGSVDYGNRPEGGACVTIEFPLTSDGPAF